jgi:hypothetical protein
MRPAEKIGTFSSLIRANARANAAPILPLGGIAGLGRDVVKVGIGTAVGGFDVVDDTSAIVNFMISRVYLVKNSFVIPRYF